YHDVADPSAEDIIGQVSAQGRRLAERLAPIGRTVAVASGKGGVGKSAVTANLAAALAAHGLAVGAADDDLNGPSLARMLGASSSGPLRVVDGAVEPAVGASGVKVMSMDLLLADDDAPVAWREPELGHFIYQSTLETGALREFLADVAWGPLDVLLIDVPPGTDKLARLVELLPGLDLLLLVTTPSEMARFVVAKSVRAAREAGVKELGLVANMTAYACPSCGHADPLFGADGARELAEAAELPLWAEIPFDPRLAAATDAGRPFVLEAPEAPAARAFEALAARVAALANPEATPLPLGAP
ncbi:MAG: P-loop NTPase, partial [Gemmatimonadota bacterium]